MIEKLSDSYIKFGFDGSSRTEELCAWDYKTVCDFEAVRSLAYRVRLKDNLGLLNFVRLRNCVALKSSIALRACLVPRDRVKL